MASETPGDVKPPATQELSQAPSVEGQVTTEPLKEVSPTSVFVNSAPIREDQVQNATKFLSNPRVRGSPVVHRRNFLERKGLTTEEIDEAFRRVPDPTPSEQTTTASPGNQKMSSPNTQQQRSAQAVIQHAGAAPPAASSFWPKRFGYIDAFLAIGFLTASSVGTVLIFKKIILPRLRSWIRRVAASDNDHEDLKKKTPSLNEEATAAAKAAAAAAADAAKASQELVIMKSEEKKHLEQFTNLMDAQLQEIKSMKTSLWKLEGKNYNLGRSHNVEEEYLNGTIARSRKPTDNGGADLDSRSARSSSPPVTSSEPPHPKSYMEIMAMIQRGERPPNIKDINDAPPNPNQPIPNPSLAPRPKPWENATPTSGSTVQDYGVTYQFRNEQQSAPSWQQKSVRIMEIENEDRSNGEVAKEQPPQRKWVPPLPPPIVMPEASEAIRQPKSVVSKDRSLNSISSNGSEIDELQKVTKISESGAELDANDRLAETGSSAEIQEEQVVS